jgi:hypothetical protein
MDSSTRPEIADALARCSLRLGRALESAPVVETLAEVQQHLRELRVFATRVQAERWYLPHYVQWVSHFVDALGEAELALSSVPVNVNRVSSLLEVRIGGALFDYRLGSYIAAAELRFHHKAES